MLTLRPVTNDRWPTSLDYQRVHGPFLILQYQFHQQPEVHLRAHVMLKREDGLSAYDTIRHFVQHHRPLIRYHRVYYVADPAAQQYVLGWFEVDGAFATGGYAACLSKDDPILECVLNALCADAEEHTHSVIVRRTTKGRDPRLPGHDIAGPNGETIRAEDLNMGAPFATVAAAILHAIRNPAHPDRPLFLQSFEKDKRVGPHEDDTRPAWFYRVPPAINWTKGKKTK